MRRTLFRYRSFNTEKLNDYSYIHQRIINIERKAGLLCLIDCDKFKSINDTYGHAVGDKVIIAIAETLQKLCHDKNVAFRLGGDEFAIFMRALWSKRQRRNFSKYFLRISDGSILRKCREKV